MPKLWKDRITVSLGMPEVEVTTVEEDGNRLQIAVQGRVDYAPCPTCGRTSDREHGHWDVRVRDLPISGKKVELIVHRRRFRCGNGCGIFPERVSIVDRYQRQTKRYQQSLIERCRSSSMQSAASNEAVGYKTIDRLYYARAHARARDLMRQPLPKVMGIDEFSGKRRVRMHVAITDLSDHPKLWDVLKTKECTAFIDFFKRYSREERSAVDAVIHDMDRGLASWTRVMFPNAVHVIDKFHLTRTLLKHQERVRKAAYERCRDASAKRTIRSAYFLIRRRKKDLRECQRHQLDEVLGFSKTLREAYELKEDFMAWYDAPKTREQASTELLHLHRRIRSLPHFKRLSWTLDQWWEGIINYFAVRKTNGFTEGMNTKIKTLKRMGYGFRNFERFRARIAMECIAA